MVQAQANVQTRMSTAGRILGALVSAALVAVTLTACSTSAGTCLTSGVESNAVQASGAFGSKPTVTFPTPTHVTSTQVSTLIEGSGPQIQADQDVAVSLTILNGTTGKTVESTKYSGSIADATTFVLKSVPVKGIGAGLVCGQVGERRAIVIPPSAGYPSANRPAKVGKNDSLVVVVDIRRAYLARANGTNQVMSGGLPSVVLAPNGQPGITVPKTDAPKQLEVANLKVGSGAVLRSGDTAVIHYTAVNWSDQSVISSSWTSGTPATITLKKGSVIPGLITALKGQRVGSQVLAILPPSQAYGSSGSGSVPANATIVFVIDVLGKA